MRHDKCIVSSFFCFFNNTRIHDVTLHDELIMRVCLDPLIAYLESSRRTYQLHECRRKSLWIALTRIIYSKFRYRNYSYETWNFAKRISVSVIEKCLSGMMRKSARFFVKRSLHTDWVTTSFTVRGRKSS